jgi:hypothetical protein
MQAATGLGPCPFSAGGIGHILTSSCAPLMTVVYLFVFYLHAPAHSHGVVLISVVGLTRGKHVGLYPVKELFNSREMEFISPGSVTFVL